MTTEDGIVIAAGTAAATANWWGQFVSWMPVVVQVSVTVGTLLFVAFRAANEIRKFWRNRNEEREEG